ncbi:O-antigen ligase family protein [Marinitenerispora sediminis]|uniref:Ligase n=1 Tax=Marinitenerispora sediminis TaxID=1931232 RepID=A0A368T7U4_9ACTN|nr:O-antigen ligase family protein [Marinitenerispora sediminis]RCV56023.1 ligase [Marinitenerispora sediminis]RCV60247.1 ligase [Marinitenerispora sediminis]RCV60989.1 ligase [Marinitenerispora sediminis]
MTAVHAAEQPARAIRLPAGWPFVALFAGYPLWWALGLGQFAFWVFAVPMAVELVRRHRAGGLRVPPGFGLWALFLVWSVAGLAFVGLTPTGALPGSGGLLGALVRIGCYLALTVLLLYVGNLSRTELSDLRVARTLGWLCLATIAGGLLGTVAPHFEFTAPAERLLPGALAADPYVQALLHPAAAQVMDVLGYEAPRPKAPWEYTNSWGNNLSLLLVWLVVGWVRFGSGWRRWAAALAVGLAAVPIVYSLNRGLWVGLALSLGFLLYWLLRRRRVAAAALCGAAALLAAAALLLSPLMAIVEQRAASPHSDDGRATSSAAAVRAANESPVAGWGATREALGSGDSIAVGRTPECPQCGNSTIGNNGHLWLLLVANGWVGAALFVGFFALTAWRHRRDRTPVGAAALLTVLLLFWYMFFYVALTAPLAITMTAVALLWRRAADRPGTAAAPVGV